MLANGQCNCLPLSTPLAPVQILVSYERELAQHRAKLSRSVHRR